MAPLRGDKRDAEMRRCAEALRGLMLGYRDRIEELLRGTGVTLPQLRMLKVIEQQKNQGSAATIARQCQITPQTLQSMLARAVREGWIVRGASERNGRYVTASLTEAGLAVLRRGMALAERINGETWDGVPLEALEAMRMTMETGLANLHRERER